MNDGGILELAVENYLGADRGIFLQPEYLIRTKDVWAARCDFLALDFSKRMVWMVEVSKDPKGLSDKIAQFDNLYALRIKEQLEQFQGITVGDQRDEWQIGFWIFGPKWAVPTLTTQMESSVRVWQLKPSLEEVFEDLLKTEKNKARFQ